MKNPTSPAKADLYALDLTEAQWSKSPYSGDPFGACVEVADLPHGGKAVRDSKNPSLAPMRYTAEEWDAFSRAIREGLL